MSLRQQKIEFLQSQQKELKGLNRISEVTERRIQPRGRVMAMERRMQRREIKLDKLNIHPRKDKINLMRGKAILLKQTPSKKINKRMF